MQPAAVDMARVALVVLLACLACTAIPPALAQLYDHSGSGSGSGSGYYYGDPTLVDQEPEDEVITESERMVEYEEDKEFDICSRYPHGKIH